MINQIHNTNIESETVITSPIDLRQKSLLVIKQNDILSSRKSVGEIFQKDEDIVCAHAHS